MQVLNDTPVQHLHSRVLTLFILLTLAYAGLAARFVYLQALPHGQRLRDPDLLSVHVPARRGDIFDRNGIPLAIAVDGYDVSIRPNLIRKLGAEDRVASSLAPVVGMPSAAIASLINLPRPFAFLKRRVSHATGQAVLSAVQRYALPGVRLDPVFLRSYPQGNLAAQVVGRVDMDCRGVDGLEKGYNSVLRGSDGLQQWRLDGKGQPIPGTERLMAPVHNGKQLRLTIDTRIQQVAEEQLEKAIEAHHAAAGCTVVVDVQSGEILAIANRPTFDPNLPVRPDQIEALRDRAIAYPYEPGSTMKMVTAAAALTEKTWNLTQTVTCRGSMMIGRTRIRCVVEPPMHGGHGTETLRDIIRNSCNIGAATIGLKLGGPKLFDYVHRFGLLDRPDLRLPGAVAYPLAQPSRWSRVRLANVAFGQGVMVTPLQLVYAYAAVADGGKLYAPQLIRKIVNADTGGVARIHPRVKRQVVTPAIAAEVRELLKGVVYDGTGKTAQIPGYSVAGKTGSAQKAGAHGYLSGQFIASFVGFAPASHPRVVCLTMIDEPKGLHWGAVCAAPVVREVLRWSLHYLQVPPDAPQLTADGASMLSVRRQEARLGENPFPGPAGDAASPDGAAGETGADSDMPAGLPAHSTRSPSAHRSAGGGRRGPAPRAGSPPDHSAEGGKTGAGDESAVGGKSAADDESAGLGDSATGSEMGEAHAPAAV